MFNLIVLTVLVSTQTVFPIPKLGNCGSALDCWEYCDLMIHRDECAAYAKVRGISYRRGVLTVEPDQGEVLAAQISYPISELGGCRSKEDCKAYCDFEINKAACVNFARAHGLATSVEKSEGKAPAVRPPGVVFPVTELDNCASVSECRDYCSREANREVCAEYARKMGIGREGEEGEGSEEKMAALGIKFPLKDLGNCSSPEECRRFCDKRANLEKCEKFAKRHGLVVEVEGPGGCEGREECEEFCSKRENQKTCMEWAKEHGIEDYPPAGGRAGPGGCMSKEECEKYCREHPDDEECRREEREMEEYCREHLDDEDCQRMAEYGPLKHGHEKPGEGGGPGGCRNPEECKKYCEDHPQSEECREFWGGQEHRGPGIVDERARYCEEHPEECQ